MPKKSKLNDMIDALQKRVENYDAKLAELEGRVTATNQFLDLAIDLLGLGDLASSEFSSEELKDAGGVIPAYLRRRGAVNRVDLHRVLAGIQPVDGNDSRRIDPAHPRPLRGMVPSGITNHDESSKGVFGHEEEAGKSAASGQAAVSSQLA